MTPPRGETRSPEERAEGILGEICQYIPDGPEQTRYFKSIRRCLEHELKQAVDQAWKEGIKEAVNVMGKYLTHHHHRFDNGVTLCQSGYSTPDSRCIIEVVRALQPPREG